MARIEATQQSLVPIPAAISAAADRIRAGGLVAFPTETVYGLGADAMNDAAVARVFEIKGRPARNPLIVHVADEASAQSVVTQWPEAAHRLAECFWPGPLSIVLARRPGVSALVSGGGPNVAVRCPDHPVALALLRACGCPLVGPSANTSGRVSPTTAEHVRREFSAEDVLVLDGGPCRAGIESTVLTLCEHPPRVLRPGIISAEEVASVLRTPIVDAVAGAAPVGSLESPGLLDRHYAPVTPAYMVDAGDVLAALGDMTAACVVISHTPIAVPPPHRLEPMPADARGYAAGLYAALRSVDERRPGAILVVRPPGDSPVWRAVLDRLGRATRC